MSRSRRDVHPEPVEHPPELLQHIGDRRFEELGLSGEGVAEGAKPDVGLTRLVELWSLAGQPDAWPMDLGTHRLASVAIESLVGRATFTSLIKLSAGQ